MATASQRPNRRSARTAKARRACALVSRNSSVWRSSSGSGAPGPAAERIRHPEAAHQQGPLVDLGREQHPEAVGGVQPPGEDRRDDQLRCLRRERRQPLDQQELVDPERLPGRDEPVGERLGRHHHDRGRGQEQAGDKDASLAPGQERDVRRDADQLGLAAPLAGHPPEVGAEERQQDDGVVPRDAARERDDERVGAGDRRGTRARRDCGSAGPRPARGTGTAAPARLRDQRQASRVGPAVASTAPIAQNATNATSGQPIPMRSRFEPVMFAAANCV